MTHKKTENKELLIALLPKTSALDILKNEGWYHIPVETAPKTLASKGTGVLSGQSIWKGRSIQNSSLRGSAANRYCSAQGTIP